MVLLAGRGVWPAEQVDGRALIGPSLRARSEKCKLCVGG